MARAKNWKTRRVTFVMSDSYHTIHLVGVRMPVRIAGEMDATTGAYTYEGPIEARLAKLETEHPEIVQKRDLVGVLIAETGVTMAGQIGWLQQSAKESGEAGADYIGRQLGRQSALR